MQCERNGTRSRRGWKFSERGRRGGRRQRETREKHENVEIIDLHMFRLKNLESKQLKMTDRFKKWIRSEGVLAERKEWVENLFHLHCHCEYFTKDVLGILKPKGAVRCVFGSVSRNNISHAVQRSFTSGGSLCSAAYTNRTPRVQISDATQQTASGALGSRLAAAEAFITRPKLHVGVGDRGMDNFY